MMLLSPQKHLITRRHDIPFMSLLKSLLTMPLKSSEAMDFPHPEKEASFNSVRFYPNGRAEMAIKDPPGKRLTANARRSPFVFGSNLVLRANRKLKTNRMLAGSAAGVKNHCSLVDLLQ